MRNPVVGMFRSVFAFTALAAVAGVHAQQKINVTAANSVSNQIYTVSFAPPVGTRSATLNTDQGSLQRLVSLAFISNINPGQNNFSFDLLAADNLMHKILRYSGDFSCPPNTSPPCGGTGTLVTQASAINYPQGLSVDSAGDLYVVNDTPGVSPQAQVWTLQTDGAGGLMAAFAIDATGTAGSTLGKKQALVETTIVPNPICGVPPCTFGNTNDLLVVSNTPDEILLYPGTPGGATGPPAQINHNPHILIPQCASKGALNCIPAGSLPRGIAVWPADNSLLVTLTGGSILRFSVNGNGSGTGNGNSVTSGTTVIGLPAGLVKIKTGLLQETGFQFGPSRAFVVQSGQGNHGSILELAPSANNIVVRASVSTGIAAPQGIAVSNTVQSPTANCGQGNGCDNFGNELLKHKVIQDLVGPGSLNSTLVESLCVVQDSRVVNHVCNGNPLTVNTVCPGFDNTTGPNPMVIPGTFCGASGSTGNGFALIKSLTAPNQFNNTYVDVEQNTDALFPNAANPVCGNNGGTATVVWAPLAGETQIVEGAAQPKMVDITDGCGTGHGGGPAVSIFAVGLALNVPAGPAMTNFAGAKYPFLTSTIQQFATNGNVTQGVAQQLTNVGGTGCVDLSLKAFNAGNYQDAADLLTNADTTGTTTCDSIVTQNLGAFTETPQTPVYNPSGQIRWRLANLYYTIETRILNQPAASGWPPPVSLSASPQGIFAKCVTDPSCPAVPNPTTATLSWALANGVNANSCTWSSNDTNFNSNLPNVTQSPATLGPFTGSYSASTYYPGANYTYTLTCSVPGMMGSTPATLTAAPSGNYSSGTLTLPWPNAPPVATSYQVTLSTGQVLSGCTLTNGSATLSCPSPHINGTPTASITVSPSTMSVSTNLAVWKAIVVTANPTSVTAGQSTQITWTPPAGATGCTLTSNGQGTANPLGTDNGPTNGSPEPVATYTSTAADAQTNGGVVTFTAACAAGASPGTAQVTVTLPITVSLNPNQINGGQSTQITWTPPAGATVCSLTSDGQGTANPIASDNGPTSGSPEPLATYTSVEADAETNNGIVTITASCTTGASNGTAPLTVLE